MYRYLIDVPDYKTIEDVYKLNCNINLIFFSNTLILLFFDYNLR